MIDRFEDFVADAHIPREYVLYFELSYLGQMRDRRWDNGKLLFPGDS